MTLAWVLVLLLRVYDSSGGYQDVEQVIETASTLEACQDERDTLVERYQVDAYCIEGKYYGDH